MKKLRKCLAVASIIIGSFAVGVPDEVVSKAMIALATGLNGASLYLLKDEQQEEKVIGPN